MKIDEKLIQICQADVLKLAEVVKNYHDEVWNVWKYRQNSYNVHSRTRSIPLIWTENGVNLSEKFTSMIYVRNFNDEICEVVSKLKEKVRGSIVKLMLVELEAHAKIPAHIDTDITLRNIKRCHLPIITNEQVRFMIDGDSFNMNEGVWYEFNNTLMHAVDNPSDTARVHLICDIY